MEPYHSPDLSASSVAMIYTLAVLGFLGLHRLGFALQPKGGERWWSATLRDLLTLCAALLLAASFWLLGIAAPVAILLASTLSLPVILIGTALHERKVQAWWWMIPITLLLGAPIAWLPGPVAMATATLLQRVFPEVSLLP